MCAGSDISAHFIFLRFCVIINSGPNATEILNIRLKKMNAVIQISETAVRYRYPIACWFLFMCSVTFIFYAADKSSAKRGTRRIKESTLLILSFIGGSAGAFTAMHILRHKTGKVKFMIGVPLSLLLHAAITLTAVYFGSSV